MARWLKKIVSCGNYAENCPEHLQIETTECGAVSLQMVMEYYGVIIPTEVMRDECQVSRDGSKASSLLKTARKFGFEASGFRIARLEDIPQFQMPAILFWEFNHFLVCLGKKGKNWVLNDPAYGRRLLSDKEMDRAFTGILLEIKPGPDFRKQGRKESFLRNMSSLLRSCKTELLVMLLVGVLLVPQSLIQPNMNSFVIDYFFQDEYLDWGFPILGFAVLMLLLTLGLIAIQQYATFLLGLRMTISNSYAVLTKLFSLPLSFFQSRFSGELTSRVQCCETVSRFFAEQFVINVLSFMALGFDAALLIYFDNVLGGFVVFFALFFMGVLLKFMRAKKAANAKLTIERGKLFGRTVHGIVMIETLKASGMEGDFFTYWGDIYKRYMKVKITIQQKIENLQLIQSLLSTMSIAFLAGFGAYRILLGQMSGGTYIAFQTIFGCFMTPICNLLNMIDPYQQARADANRLIDVLHYPLPPRNPAAALPANEPGKIAGKVEIRDLVFGYNRNLPPVIDHIDLEILPGERVAIVGLSGSGKSTMAKLISGAYQPWSGEILFDGRPRDAYSQSELRYSFAMVDQAISLFPGTIRDNIAMYDPTLPFKSIRQAAEDALIHDVISARTNGYSHKINATGNNFSGGEQQRLEIARALAVNPSILLLDEATAALDPSTEQKIDNNLRHRGVTTIVIAHRLSTIRDADRIIVLEHGKIAECGTHNELLKLNGIYAKLVNL